MGRQWGEGEGWGRGGKGWEDKESEHSLQTPRNILPQTFQKRAALVFYPQQSAPGVAWAYLGVGPSTFFIETSVFSTSSPSMCRVIGCQLWGSYYASRPDHSLSLGQIMKVWREKKMYLHNWIRHRRTGLNIPSCESRYCSHVQPSRAGRCCLLFSILSHPKPKQFLPSY